MDRHQIYENKQKGISKAAHERMLNGAGRKIVKEHSNNETRSFDHFKRMGAADVDRFDQDWNRVANKLGFNASNALEYHGGQAYEPRGYGGNPRGDKRRAEARGLGMPDGGYSDSRGLGYVDEGRRGHFIPDYARDNDA